MNPFRPFRLALSALAVLTLAFAVPASAQQIGAGAPMPLGVDVSKVPTGLWADYAMTLGPLPPMKSHFALVAKKPGAQTLEMSVEGGMMAAGANKMVMQTILDDHKGSAPKVKKVVVQMGANDPMQMPEQAAQQAQFTRPDAKTLVGEETVKVPAGTFKTKHYRDKGPNGQPLDYCLSEAAPPLGLVKMEGDPRVPNVPGPLRLELSAMGKGAKPVVVKPPVPYDDAKLRAEATGGQPAPAAPPAPAPAPGGKK